MYNFAEHVAFQEYTCHFITERPPLQVGFSGKQTPRQSIHCAECLLRTVCEQHLWKEVSRDAS